jgi:hypothetical protein
MRRILLRAAALLFTVALLAGHAPAWGQGIAPRGYPGFPPYGGYVPAPAVSPYINLANPNLSPAISYYGIVRPELQTRAAIFGLQNQVNTLGYDQAATDQAARGVLVTGHPVFFLNYSHYYGDILAPGAAGAAPSAGIGAARGAGPAPAPGSTPPSTPGRSSAVTPTSTPSGR